MGAWDRVFATNPTSARRVVVATLLATGGFALVYVVHRATSFYFTPILLVTVVAISLYCGARLGVAFAIVLSLMADYSFIPPVGTILSSTAGWEHFAIIVAIAVCAAFAGSSVRNAFRAALASKREAEESSRAMESMLALVTHDVRNPLSTAKMAVQVMLDDADEERRRARSVILRNLEQADAIIQSLLDVAAIRAGQTVPLEKRSCDLAAEVRRIVSEQQVGRSDLSVRDEGAVWGLWGLSGLERALRNLIVNALKYGAKSAPIEVRLVRDGDRARLSVHNEGEPISPDEQRTIFRPFQRTERGKSRSSGWGLGLVIVQAVAEAHGGSVSVVSDAEHGTTFTLDLPIVTSDRTSSP